MLITTTAAVPSNTLLALACEALKQAPPEIQAVVTVLAIGFCIVGVGFTAFLGYAKTEYGWRAWSRFSRWLDGKRPIGFRPPN